MNRLIPRLRDFLCDLSCTVMNWADDAFPWDHPDSRVVDIGRWLNNVFSTLFGLAYPGSDCELLHAEDTPPRYLSVRQRLHLGLDDYAFDAHCVHCLWDGDLDDTSEDYGCPDCGEAVYLFELGFTPARKEQPPLLLMERSLA